MGRQPLVNASYFHFNKTDNPNVKHRLCDPVWNWNELRPFLTCSVTAADKVLSGDWVHECAHLFWFY